VFGSALDLLTNLDNQPLTSGLEFTVFQANLHSGDSLSLFVNRGYERLEEDFEIQDGITLPGGSEYHATRYGVNFSTANKRVLAVGSNVELGGFFSGRRQDYSLDVTLRARPGLIVYSTAQWNRVQLAEGSFQTRVYRLTPEVQFSPWVSLVNSLQYDSVSRVLGWQGRFRWIVRPGNDFFFVYTHNWSDDPAKGLETLERRAATKLIYTHRF
jgi:hypothetical protein